LVLKAANPDVWCGGKVCSDKILFGGSRDCGQMAKRSAPLHGCGISRRLVPADRLSLKPRLVFFSHDQLIEMAVAAGRYGPLDRSGQRIRNLKSDHYKK
jgi:hypothetical protein